MRHDLVPGPLPDHHKVSPGSVGPAKRLLQALPIGWGKEKPGDVFVDDALRVSKGGGQYRPSHRHVLV
jgi:hypothetical protein